MKTLSIADIAQHGGRHVTAETAQTFLSVCAEADTADRATGEGFELALARSAEGGEVAPEWVQIFPAGPTIRTRDHRTFTLADPSVLIAALAAHRADLPVDIEHAQEIRAPKGEDAPAQGWIKELEIRDGATWARVDWNAHGALLVTSKSYRYVSPAFRHTKAGQITRVTSLALTNQPALDLPALARSGGADHPEQEHQDMTLAARLAAAFGLAAAASDDAIVQAATEQVALARETRDPTKYVPVADLQSALARATTAEQSLVARETADAETAASTAVDAAIAAGKIAPVSRDHWLSIAREAPDAFAGAVKDMPALGGKPLDKKPDGDIDALTAEQKAVCRQLGLDEAVYAKTLKEAA
jgi:phage I-like protein